MKHHFLRLICFVLLASMLLLTGCEAGTDAPGTDTGKTSGSDTEAAPVEKTKTVFYVSPDGDDTADGSENAPFATPARAVEAVRALTDKGEVTVLFHAGEYAVDSLSLTAENGGTEGNPVTYAAFGDGEVRFNSGTSLPADKFTAVTDEEILSRLSEDVRGKVRCLDLAALGITAEMIGRQNAVGSYSTAGSYPDGLVGTNSELYWGDEHMVLARYPNDDYTVIGTVISDGNPSKQEPLILKVRDRDRERIKGWKEPTKIWAFGFFMFDWAEMSSPIDEFDQEEGVFTLRYASSTGAKRMKRYYFYNVLEELDAPGEYYLDRDAMKLYVYPPEGKEDVSPLFAMNDHTMLSGTVSDVTFRGITFEGVRGDSYAIELNGDRITLDSCMVRNVVCSAIDITGSDNLITGCEIYNIGQNGIVLHGGDEANLIRGNSKIENCYIHDFGQIKVTYSPGVSLFGCGNILTHCEISDTPHMALWYYGPWQDVSYNYVHDTTYDSNDAGCVYCGGSYTSCGSVLRYNLFERIGKTNNDIRVIYFDDGYSFGTVYGNVVRDCFGVTGLCIGGGRGFDVHNNIFLGGEEGRVNCSGSYDSRFAGEEGIMKRCGSTEGIISAYGLPVDNQLWLDTFPEFAKMTYTAETMNESTYIGNPADSVITGNIFYGYNSGMGALDDIVPKFSDLSGDLLAWTSEEWYNDYINEETGTKNTLILAKSFSDIFSDIETCTVKQEVLDAWGYDFEPIPFDEIGRYK